MYLPIELTMRTRIDHWNRYHLIAALAMTALGLFVTRQAWADIYNIALHDPEHSHIFLVPLVAAWMMWVRGPRFRHTRPVGSGLGLLLVILGWLISSFGFYNGHQSLWHGGSVLIVIGCAFSILGRHVFFRFFPAIGVLIFLIPIPGNIRLDISRPLQEWTSIISQQLLNFIGMNVERSGNLLRYNGVPVNIVDACNGMRMVFALLLVAYAFSFGLPLKNSVRFCVLAISPLAALACNVVRIVPAVWVYGNYPDHIGAQFHHLGGWIMLPIAFLLLLGFIKLLRWAMVPVLRYTLASQGA